MKYAFLYYNALHPNDSYFEVEEFYQQKAWKNKLNQKQDIVEVKAEKLKSSYSSEPINNKGILSDVGYTPSSIYNNPSSLLNLGAGSNITSAYTPTVKTPSDLHSSINRKSGTVSPELSNVVSELETGSKSSKYSHTLPGSSSILPSRISPEKIVSGLTPSSSGSSNPSRITPESIISGLAPSNPIPDRPSSIVPSSIVPSSIVPSSVIPGSEPGGSNRGNRGGGEGGSYSGIAQFRYTPIPTPRIAIERFRSDSGRDRSTSNVSITGSDFIFKTVRFGKDKTEDNRKKQSQPGVITGVEKRGHLRNQFGSLEGFAKKAFSGDKVGFKKMKIR